MASIFFLFFVLRPLRPNKNWPDIKLKYLLCIFYFWQGDLCFQKVRNGELFLQNMEKTLFLQKMENVNFIFKFILFSYIKNLLGIVIKLKIK